MNPSFKGAKWTKDDWEATNLRLCASSCRRGKKRRTIGLSCCSQIFLFQSAGRRQDAQVLLRLLRHLPDPQHPQRQEDPLRRQEAQGECQVLLPEMDGGPGEMGRRVMVLILFRGVLVISSLS